MHYVTPASLPYAYPTHKEKRVHINPIEGPFPSLSEAKRKEAYNQVEDYMEFGG